MKIRGLILVTFLGVLLVGTVSCGGPGLPKPRVGYVPQGWACLNDFPYGEFEDKDGKYGLLFYAELEDVENSVWIAYGGVPKSLEGRETDMDALIAWLTQYSDFSYDPEDVGTMIVDGELAGYAKAYDPAKDGYEMKIVCVKGSTCIKISAWYGATYEEEAEVMTLIGSISF